MGKDLTKAFLLLQLIFSWTILFSQVLNQPSISGNVVNSSSKDSKVNWTTNPYDQKIFIENNGQFDTILKTNAQVFYGADLVDMKAYFTSNGLTYFYDEPNDKKEDEKKSNRNKEFKNPDKRKVHYLQIEWIGANPQAVLEASEKRSDYYVYPAGVNSSLQANLYKKITYKEMYPGIDIEYIFPADKGGLKYSIIVHPGADYSKAKLKYIGAAALKKNINGDVVIKTIMGDFIDHAPVGYYLGETDNQVITMNNINDNIESFILPQSYNSNKTLIIDPWTTNPISPSTSQGPFDLEYDYNGNVYTGSQFGVVKLNNTGAIIWTYKGFIGSYEDFTVNRNTGNAYIVGFGANGAQGNIQRISNVGGLVNSNNSPTNRAWEFWRVVWNPCTDQIIIGAGGTNGSGPGTNTFQAAITDLNLTAIAIRNVMGVTGSNYDMVGVAVDPSGSSCYMANTRWTATDPNYQKLIKLPLPAFTPTLFNVRNGYLFEESQTLGAGMNVITAGNSGVYMWDGYTLKRFNNTTGALVGSNIILPTQTVNGAVKAYWSGIDVDACEKIYVGFQKSIRVYDSLLVLRNTVNLAANLDSVWDVKIGMKGKTLYACGRNFVTSIDVYGQATDSIAKLTTVATCSCNGTARADLFVQCGNLASVGVSYLWSNGQTTQTATGLCAGVHNVTLTYNCKPYTDTVTIKSPSGLSLTHTQSNVQCFGGNTGSSSIVVSGGLAPYSYSWSSGGGTNSIANNLVRGIYTVSITDANGCQATSIINITEPIPPIASSSSTNNSCTTTGRASVSVAAAGPISYAWSNGTSGPTAFGLIAGNYTVTVTVGSGCTQTRSFTITGVNPVSATFTQSHINACIGTTVTFTNTGSTGSHQWLKSNDPFTSGTTANFSASFFFPGTYTITHIVTSGGCTASVSSNVVVTNCSAPNVTASGNSVCPGSCANVTSSGTGGTGPYTYSWSNGSTTQNINPCPVVNTTYTVTVRDAGGSTSTSIALVTINPPINASANSTNIICSGGTGSVSSSGTGGSSPYTYNWTPSSGSGPTISGLSAGNYSVTITDSKGCTGTSVATIVAPLPLVGLFTKGTATCTGCGCKEWLMINATGGTSPYNYLWQDGYTSRYKNQLCPGAHAVNIKDKNGCPINISITTP